MARDVLIELKKNINYTLNKRSTSDDINYDEMFVIAYRTNIKGLFQLHGEKPIILQVRKPVAQTRVIVAVPALRDPSVIRHLMCSKFKDYNSTAKPKISGMTFAKKGHIECLKFAGTEINQHSGKT